MQLSIRIYSFSSRLGILVISFHYMSSTECTFFLNLKSSILYLAEWLTYSTKFMIFLYPKVAPAVVSVIPYPSYNGISRVWNNLRISGLIGAAPVIAYTQFDIPIASFAFFLITPPRIGTFIVLSSI